MKPGVEGLLREDGQTRVDPVELFFDLVFVFALTQLSHTLMQHLTPLGALQAGVLFLAVWWLWIDTAWAMNWLHPERTPVRLLIFVMMLAGLCTAVAIPSAFEAGGMLFAGAHVAIQLGRTAFVAWAFGADRAADRRNFHRILGWKLLAAPLWLGGALVDPTWRLALWAAAVAVEQTGPLLRFRLPGLGASDIEDWQLQGEHLAERCALFVIIALGESILVTGATFAGQDWTPGRTAAFAVAFAGSVAMWWIYFDTGAERGTRHIADSDRPGGIARSGYTYLHVPIGAGIVLCAVADEVVLAHPDGHADIAAQVVMLGGPAIYLLGVALFKRLSLGWLPLSHRVGLGVLAALVPVAGLVPLVALGAATSLTLLLVAVWERLSLHGKVEA